MNDFELLKNLSHLNSTKISNTSHKCIIVDTIYNYKSKISEDEIISEIKKQFGIDVSKETLSIMISQLIDDGVTIITDHDFVSLNPKTILEIDKQIESFDALKNQVLDDWSVSFKEDLDQSELNLFKKYAADFIKRYFLRHGVASYSMLTNESHGQEQEQSLEIDVNKVVNITTQQYTGAFKDVLNENLPKLFEKPIPAKRREYLEEELRKAITYLSSVARPEIIQSITEEIKELVIYLDTNVIYRLLHLQGEERFVTIKRVIDICLESHIKIKVSLKTYQELQSRICYDASIVAQHEIPVNLAGLGYSYRSTDNYVSTFWEARRKSYISADDFNAIYKQPIILLNDLQIEVETEAVEESSVFLQSARDIFSKIFQYDDSSNQKSNNSAWHDAYNIALVKSKQNPTATNAINANCLFMTTDRILFKLQRIDYDFKHRPEVVILPSQILQIICFTKPCSDYSETFISLFSISSTSYHSTSFSNIDIQDILARISHFSQNSWIAQKILEDQLISSKLNSAKDDSEKDEIINDAVTDALNTKIVKDEEIIKDHQQKIHDISIEKDTLRSRTELLEEKVNKLEESGKRDLEKVKTEFKTTISDICDKASNEIDILSSDYSEKKWERWRNTKLTALSFLFLIIVILIITFIPYTSHFVEPLYTILTKIPFLKDDSNWGPYGFIALLCILGSYLFVFSLKLFSPNIKAITKGLYNAEFYADLEDKKKMHQNRKQ